jgi:outer membrane protein OmpA-like peptidoglycan-associated protein
MLEDSSLLDFNFWPSFADSMLAVVFILVVILVFVAQQGLRLPEVRDAQSAVVQSIEDRYEGSLDTLSQDLTRSKYAVKSKGEPVVEIRHDVQLQRITFSGNVLFSQNDYRLTPRGKEVLQKVGGSILPQLRHISQIQIEGHTDILPTDQYPGGNLELGARRARSVYRFLEKQVGIDPVRHLMSTTSYGKYSPVGRSPTEDYDEEKLREANDTISERRRNRRIELLLFYDNAGARTSSNDAPSRSAPGR